MHRDTDVKPVTAAEAAGDNEEGEVEQEEAGVATAVKNFEGADQEEEEEEENETWATGQAATEYAK